jgi:hypothetical protein
VKEFIDGKRKVHQSPVSYFLIWTTIYILFLYWIEKVFGENVAINYKQYFGPDATTRFAMSHLSIVLIVVMPFQALFLYLIVTRKWYYYFETLVATIYSLGTVILLQFVFAVGAVLIHLLTGATADLRISDAFKIIYIAWFIFDVIKLFAVNHRVIRAIAFIILAFGTFTLWRIYALPALIDWLFLKE